MPSVSSTSLCFEDGCYPPHMPDCPNNTFSAKRCIAENEKLKQQVNDLLEVNSKLRSSVIMYREKVQKLEKDKAELLNLINAEDA